MQVNFEWLKKNLSEDESTAEFLVENMFCIYFFVEWLVRFVAYPSEEDAGISGSLGTGASWESSNTQRLCIMWEFIGKKGNFLDAGSNIGTYALPMVDCARGNGSVIAVEGMPDIANHLCASIVENGLLHVVQYPYAAGGKPRRDEVVRSLNSAIEGNEGLFLEGTSELFSKYPPCIVVAELVPEWLVSVGTSVAAILLQIWDWGYEEVPPEKVLCITGTSRSIGVQVLNKAPSD